MYNTYPYQNQYPYQYLNNQNNPKDDRFVGGFVFPFLLGGVTGAAVAPAFWNNNNYNNSNKPYYNNYYYPYPIYGPYYR